MKFNDLYEATMKKFDDGCCTENMAYDIAYNVKPVGMPLIKSSKPSKNTNAWWNYQTNEGTDRTATVSIRKHRNNFCVGCYIGDKDSNKEYDEANNFPHTFKKWDFKITSNENKMLEISQFISKAIKADMDGKTITD